MDKSRNLDSIQKVLFWKDFWRSQSIKDFCETNVQKILKPFYERFLTKPIYISAAQATLTLLLFSFFFFVSSLSGATLGWYLGQCECDTKHSFKIFGFVLFLTSFTLILLIMYRWIKMEFFYNHLENIRLVKYLKREEKLLKYNETHSQCGSLKKSCFWANFSFIMTWIWIQPDLSLSETVLSQSPIPAQYHTFFTLRLTQ